MSTVTFNGPEFTDLLKSKEWEIIEQAKNQILSNKNFPILKDYYLKNFWLDRADKKDVFIFLISKDHLLTIELDKVEDQLSVRITESLKTHSVLQLNNKFEVLSEATMPYTETQKVRDHLIEESKKGNCIFLFGEKGISTFIEGHESGENIFLTTQDLLNHTEKYEIEDIKKALKRYKDTYLTMQHNYKKFFESKGILIKIYGDSTYNATKNLLLNSPEKFFRDDLIDFLKQNVKGTFNREMQLHSSKKPIDIYTESKKDGKLVFFEVKWLGCSFSKDKTKISIPTYESTRAHSAANEAVIQTLEYIEELIVKMETDLKCGYLIIFDARNVKDKLQYNDPANLPDNLKPFYKDKFDKVDDLIVDNLHPVN